MDEGVRSLEDVLPELRRLPNDGPRWRAFCGPSPLFVPHPVAVIEGIRYGIRIVNWRVVSPSDLKTWPEAASDWWVTRIEFASDLPSPWRVPEGYEFRGRGACRSCGAQVSWLRYVKTGRTSPYNDDAVSHFVTCPQAERWRKPERDD